MSEYIRKEDVLNLPQSIERNLCGEIVERSIDVKDIESLEPVDVAPVVFCKDCRKRRKDGYCTKFIQNISGIASAWYMPQDDDFCSYGERREE